MGAGPQDNESAIEQAKDEQMSDFIRGKVMTRLPSACEPSLTLCSTRAKLEPTSPSRTKNEWPTMTTLQL